MTLLMIMNLGFAWGTVAVTPRTAARQFTWRTVIGGQTYNYQPNQPTWNVVPRGVTVDTY